MRILPTVSMCAAAFYAMLCTAAPSTADEIAWLAGDVVEVAAHRATPFPEPSSHPLTGYLARTKAPGPHPAIVVLHGCTGLGSMEIVVADVLRSFGYLALALDSLGDANVCSGDAADSALAEAFDAYAALDWLAQQDDVDSNRVALLGFSMGGGAVLDAVEPGLIEDKKPRHFRAAIAYYPGGCKYKSGLTTVPTLILVGDKDDWSLASECREMVARRDGKGAPVTLIVYPEATHAFNIPAPPREYLRHHLEYDAKATAAAWTQVRSFLHVTLNALRPAGDAH